MDFWLVGIGGFAGALLRYYVGQGVGRWLGASFPYGTFLINVSGSWFLGFVGTLALDHGTLISPAWRLLLMVGFVGAFTTFSTFMFEGLQLVRQGAIAEAAWYVGGSVAVGFAAVWVGYLMARLVP